MKIYYVSIILLILIAGCTASGPSFSPVSAHEPNKAIVYVYRPFDVVGSGLAPKVYIDGVKYDPLKNKGYLVYFVEPGKRMLELRDAMWDEPMTIYPEFAPEKEYYFRLSFGSNFGGIKIGFGEIPKEYALQEIKYTKRAIQQK